MGVEERTEREERREKKSFVLDKVYSKDFSFLFQNSLSLAMVMMPIAISSSSRCIPVPAAAGRSGSSSSRGAATARRRPQRRRQSNGLMASFPSATLLRAAAASSSSDRSGLSPSVEEAQPLLEDVVTADSEKKSLAALARAVAKFAVTAALLSAVAWVFLPSGSSLAAATKACCKKGGATVASVSSFSIAETAKSE